MLPPVIMSLTLQVCLQASEVSWQQDGVMGTDNPVRVHVAWGVAWILPLLLPGDDRDYGRERGEVMWRSCDLHVTCKCLSMQVIMWSCEGM